MTKHFPESKEPMREWLLLILTFLLASFLVVLLLFEIVMRFVNSVNYDESNLTIENFHVKVLHVLPSKLYMPDEYIFDGRILAIKRLYTAYRSDLGDYALYMVKIADKYSIDWRLIPAISIIESTGGRFNFRPYNAWGLMTSRQFKNYYESIDFVGRLLASYYKRGCENVQCISRSYCPPTYGEWARKVLFVERQLNNLIEK